MSEKVINIVEGRVYAPRKKFVLLQLVYVPHTKTGVHLPQRSAEGTKWIVVAKGPDVEDLEVGDEVVVMGIVQTPEQEGSIVPVPRMKGVFLTDEGNVLLRVRENDAE